MINHFERLANKCEQLIEDTDIEARKAELRNILSVLRMEIALLENEPPTNRVACTFEEMRERVRELIKNPDSAGKHQEYKEELQLVQDMDQEDDLI